MLRKRVLWSLTGYFSLLTLVFTAIMLIPSVSEGIFATPEPFFSQLQELIEPLPELWLALLPTVFMLSVLATFSRLNLSGDIKIWRSAGSSAWPFAVSTALFGLLLGAIMTGLLWPWSQPEDAANQIQRSLTFETEDGSQWSFIGQTLGEQGQSLYLFDDKGGMVQGLYDGFSNNGTLQLREGWIAGQSGVTPFPTLSLSPAATNPAIAPTLRIINTQDLTYRLTYPIVLVGLGLLMLPLALSIDGQRLTLVKITGACLLALNALFVLLMTDAMARAGIWAESPFFILRAALVLIAGLLALLLVEERAA